MTGTFHEGELAVQKQAGVGAQAARLSGMLGAPRLDGGMRAVLAARDFAVVTARDDDQRLWTSPIFAAPGFLDAHGTTLGVHASPRPNDPLSAMATGQPIGLLAIDFATRRRVRVNGTLTRSAGGELEVDVEQAYGNCPQYIQQRHLSHTGTTPAADEARRWDALSANHVDQIRRADTFFLGTVHPAKGADASHRGGAPGFVRVDGGTLWWPDYPGNNMFNSLGNLAVDPTAALLFVDFDTGATLHLSGTAEIEWTVPGIDGDDGGTGRRVRFTVEEVTSEPPLDMRSDLAEPSPYNPALT